MSTYTTLADLPPNFWAKVDQTETCWLWTGANVRGYGQFTVDGRRVYVHRLTYALAHQITLPASKQIDHLCRVVQCCRPLHLELVTARENTMRSNAVSAINARKTACLMGHPYDEENTYVTPRGCRDCRTCKAARNVRRRQMGLR